MQFLKSIFKGIKVFNQTQERRFPKEENSSFEFSKNYQLNMGLRFNGRTVYEPEDWLKFLLLEDVIIVNNGWWLTEKGEWPKDKITLHVDCSDVFTWGCADAEDINFSEIEDLGRLVLENPKWGSAIWCIRKRNMMPQPPVEDAMRKDGVDTSKLIQLNDLNKDLNNDRF